MRSIRHVFGKKGFIYISSLERFFTFGKQILRMETTIFEQRVFRYCLSFTY